MDRTPPHQESMYVEASRHAREQHTKDLEAENERLRAYIHRLCMEGEQFAAFMHPNDDEAKPAHRAALRKWRTLTDEATRAALKGEE